MSRTRVPLLALALAGALALSAAPAGLAANAPDVVTVASGRLKLRAYLWRPSGNGPFPAVLFSHGSYGRQDPLPIGDATGLGAMFARHGYVFLFLFRQGIGLSAGQGTADGDQMAHAFVVNGQQGRNRVQLQLLEHEELNESRAALAFLRALPGVDARRLAVAGHSFGGALALLLAARDARLRAAVVFAGAANSWGQSPPLRTRLLAAVRRTSAPVLFLHAANDYSIAPGQALSDEMERLSKPHQLKIYRAVGQSARDGHNLVYRNASTWEADVFAFLDARLRP